MAEVDRVEVKVTPDLDGFRAKVAAELSKIRDLKVGLDPDVSGFRQKVQAELAGLRTSVEVDVDRGDFTLARAQMQAQANANPVEVPVKIDRDSVRRAAMGLTSLTGSAFRFAGTTAGVAGIGIAASTAAAGLGAMVVQAVPLAAALGQASGAALLLPGLLAGAGAAAATLAVGLSGVGQAFKDSGDPEKYAEALAKLAPAAQDFVQAGVGMKDVLSDIKQEVQQNLFTDLGDELRAWNTNLIPALRRGMSGIAGGLNDAAQSLMQTLGSAKVSSAIEMLFGNTGKGLSASASGIGAWTAGLVGLSAGASVFFEQLGRGFTDAGMRFNRWVDTIVANGQLETWIRRGMDAFQDLASILGNIGSGLAGVFRAAQAAGGDMLGRWDAVTEGFADWANSASGQSVLTGFFDAVGDLTAALGPVAISLFGVAGSIAEGVAGIATAFAPFAATVLNNLNPVIDTLAGILTDAAPPFGRFLDVISQSLGPAFEHFGPGVQAVFEALAESAPAIGSILESIGRIGGAVLQGIADVLPTIAGALDTFAGFLADVVEAIGPVPAAIAAFVAALAIGSIGGGAGGKGFGGKIKGAIVTGGVLAMLDVAMEDFPKTGKEMGLNFAQGVAGGVAAGFAVGGPVGAAIGGIFGAASAFHPVFMEAGQTAWNTFAKAFGNAQLEYGDKWLSGAGWDTSGIIPLPSFEYEVKGKGTHVPGDPQMEARWAETTAKSKEFYSLLDEMYINDYELYEKYEWAKDGTKQQRIEAAKQMEKEYSNKQAEYAERGGNAQAKALEKSAARRELAVKKSSQILKDAFVADGTAMRSAMSGAAESVEADAKKSADGTKTAFGTALAEVVAKSQDMAYGIGVSIGSAEESFKVAGAGMTSAMGTAASSSQSSWTGAAGAMTSAMGGASSSISQGFFSAGSAASYSASQSTSSWFGFGSSAGGVVDAFYRKFNSRAPQDASIAQARGAASAWAGMFGVGTSLGGNYGDGLASGINSRVGSVRAASARLASAARDAVILQARIASPSKVARGLGEYWGEGLAQGIEAKASRVSQAAASAMRAANVDVAAESVQTTPTSFTIVDSRGDLVMMGNLAAQGVTARHDQQSADDARFARLS